MSDAVGGSAGIVTYREALRGALHAALAADERVVVLGQDVGARGGSYGVTAGLLEAFGPGRVLDAPSSEAAIVGVAIGAAMTGLRPVAELTTATFAGLAYDQLAHHAAPLATLSGGRVRAPLVVRMPQSAGARLGPVHSSNVEALLHHIPGLAVWAPSTPADAGAMLRAAIEEDGPVVLLEHTLLYDSTGPASEDEDDAVFAPGQAALRRTGDDLTLVAASRMVGLALAAAERLQADGLSASVLDLRTLRPLDEATIVAATSSTGHALLIEEGPPNGGITATLSALLPRSIAIQRLTGADTPIPYAATLEAAALPTVDRIVAAAHALLAEEPGPEEAATVGGEAAPPFLATAPVDVEALLQARRGSAEAGTETLAVLLADAIAPLLPTAVVTADGDTVILGHLSPGPAVATVVLGPVATRPSAAEGAVTVRHVAPLTLRLAAGVRADGEALFAALRERVASAG